MKQGLFAIFAGVLALAWGSLLVRRYQGASELIKSGTSGFADVTKALFSA
jgi:hypothetical protein